MPIPDTLDSLTLRRDRIQQEFASLGDLRPGSLTRRLQQCGKPGCRCKAEGATGHGPYWSLTFKVQGKTVTRSIPAAAVERTRGTDRRAQAFPCLGGGVGRPQRAALPGATCRGGRRVR